VSLSQPVDEGVTGQGPGHPSTLVNSQHVDGPEYGPFSRDLYSHRAMRLTTEELRVFEAACADQTNRPAQELVNALGASEPGTILSQITLAPQAIHSEFARNIREAINEQRRRPFRRI
jgi:hypothetical protein